MCILCVIQKWTLWVAGMLHWLVLPLVGLWAFSQLFPPPFRFEITLLRLVSVLVLLFILCWYRVLAPMLCSWRIRRNARLRERKRFEAIELQKLRKTATRRCRNCQTPYRDQNPGGGRFMCSYCGHISRRPVLDLPVPVPNSGIIKDLVGKGGKILNGKEWSENAWMCGQDWLENRNLVSGSVAGKPSYWGKNGTGVFGGDEDCLAEKSYSGVAILACKLLTALFMSIRWLLRKIFRVSSTDDASFDSDHRGLKKRGENGTSFNESRVEKAHRKAEERRQARLEKELLEEEERKQREEVARLVEEQRRLRDEKLEAEKDRSVLSPPAREKEMKKEAEKKRQERKKEKDKASSKSNSDAEEVEKRAGKETDRKRDIDKKSEIDWRDHQKSGIVNVKGHTVETGHGMKNVSANNFNRGNAGTRYFDRMKGTFLSSSKAFSGSSFFGKKTNNRATITKENRTNNSVDHAHASVHRKDFSPSECVSGKLSLNGDDKIVKTIHPVLSDPQPRAATKKSWQQLFTCSSSVAPISNPRVISRPNSKIQAEPEGLPLPSHSTIQTFDNPISFGLLSPFISRNPNGAPGSSLGFSPAIEPIFPRAAERLHECTPEEPEHYEDPCYVPDLSSLLGPISESLDNFQLDLSAGFGTDMGMEKPCALKSSSAASEINRPSPIESPFSRLRSTDETHCNSNRFLTNPKPQDLHTFPAGYTNANEIGTWQMWNSSPLGQGGLGLVGGSASWLLPLEHNRSNKEECVLPSTQKTMASLFSKEDHIPAGTQSPQKFFLGNGQNGGTSNPVIGPSDNDPWLQNPLFPPLYVVSDNHSPIECEEEISEMSYGSPSRSACSHPFESSPLNCWPKKEWAMQGPGEAVVKSSVGWPHVGGLYPNPDVQPLLW